jgi:hypothetical protein
MAIVYGMTLPVARTILESMIYMELNPCACGESSFESTEGHLLEGDGGQLVRRRIGVCPRCRAPREFVFGLPDIAQSGGESWGMFFGGDEPSQLIDAGEWLLAAHNLASGYSTTPDPDPAVHDEQRERCTMAVAAINEVLKFIGPGLDEPPDGAFWTERGRAKRVELPGRLRQGRLRAYRSGLLGALDGLGGPWYQGRPVTGQLP